MIDTITLFLLRNDRNEEIYQACLNNASQLKHGWLVESKMGVAVAEPRFVFTQFDYDEHSVQIINGKIPLPSHSYRPYFRIYEDRVKFEFSLPKFLYSTNAMQLITHNGKIRTPYFYFRESIKEFFLTVFSGHTVDLGAVEIFRWDVCFNQIYDSYEQSLEVLEYFKHLNNQNGNIKTYEYGLIELSRSKYFKIYHKGEEYRKHDRKEVNYKHFEKFQRIADKTLRYERKFTQKNVAYRFNMKYLFKDAYESREQYLKLKRNDQRIPRSLRGMFENKRNFTVGKPTISGYFQLPSTFFNELWVDFWKDSKKRYTVKNLSYDYLEDLADKAENGRKRGKLNQIHMIIEKYGSLKRAYDKKKIAKATYYRWKKYMDDNSIDTQITKVSVAVAQDWGFVRYKNELSRECLIAKELCRNVVL